MSKPLALDRSKLTRALIVVIVGLIIWFLPPVGKLKPEAMHLTAIFIATILGLILQPLPQGAVVILGVAFTAMTNTLSISDSLADAVLAPATPSNTARAGGILFPIVRSLSSSMDSEPGPTAKRAGAFLMFNSFQTCVITSAMFLTGVAPNSMIVKLAKDTFKYEITWMGWFWAALVPGLISLAVLPYVLYKLFDPELKHSPEAPAMARRELEKMGPMSLGEKGMLTVFVATLALWATGQWTNLNATAIALAGVATLLVLGVIAWEDVLAEKGAWDALAWFGGLVGLAGGLSKLGVIKLLSDTLKTSLSGVHLWVLAFVLVVLAYKYSHYFIASMTAHATAFYVPLALVAASVGAPVPLVVIVLGFMNSLNASMTHYGTGPAPVYFGSNYIDQATWWRNGLIVSLVNVVVWLGAGGIWWKAIGLW